jgi:hypothetical protein
MKITHKKFGEFTIKVDPLLQKHIEAFFKKIREGGVDLDAISAPEYAGACVRAAVELDWIEPLFNVDESEPKKVVWINGEIQKFIAEAFSDSDPN